MKISAWAVKKKGGMLERFEYEKELGHNDVCLKIKYCSLTRGDVRFIDNYWGDVTYPFVPGLEIMGTVSEKGSDVETLNIGDQVGVGYQVYSCFNCEYCGVRKEQFCLKQKVIPVNDYGGLADKIIVDHRFVFPLPKELFSTSVAPLMCAGLTTFSAIKRAGVKKGMTVGVVGIGSLGHLAIQFLKCLGCHVTSFTHTQDKTPILKKLGVEKVVFNDDEPELKKMERKYDVIISTSSASRPWELFIKALKSEGTLCFVGLPPEKISFPAELLADYGSKKIVGNYIGSRQDMKEMLDFASKHNIQAIVKEFPMNQINEAVSEMRQNKIPFSVVITITT